MLIGALGTPLAPILAFFILFEVPTNPTLWGGFIVFSAVPFSQIEQSRNCEPLLMYALLEWRYGPIGRFFFDPENNTIEIFADIHPRDTLVEPSGSHVLID